MAEMASPPRRSEDLLSKASPRVCDVTSMAQKSRSVELGKLKTLHIDAFPRIAPDDRINYL